MPNVYDFDNTVFRGDSGARFIAFAAVRNPAMLIEAPGIILAAIRYKAGRLDLYSFKKRMYRYIPRVKNIEELVMRFWDKNIVRIKPWYTEKKDKSDVIISASPHFLVSEACARLGVSCIASDVDMHTGECRGENCRDEQKVKLLFQNYPDFVMDEFYSDALHDAPLAKYAKKAWLVSGDTLTPWPIDNM